MNCRYEAAYSKDIPEIITGDAFLEKYGDHNDMVTVIDPKRSYSVKAPTRHPIYENFRVEVRYFHQNVLFSALCLEIFTVFPACCCGNGCNFFGIIISGTIM